MSDQFRACRKCGTIIIAEWQVYHCQRCLDDALDPPTPEDYGREREHENAEPPF